MTGYRKKAWVRKDCKYINEEKWCKHYRKFVDRNFLCPTCEKYEQENNTQD